jgi:putative transposase
VQFSEGQRGTIPIDADGGWGQPWALPGQDLSTVPRQPRIDLPGIAQHVIQRGNDRQPCFFTDADYQMYLTELRELALQADVAIHAYVLMTNHVHLLMTPTDAGRISRLMQALGRRFVRYVNDRHHRTGTLWEGRYKACPVGDHGHLLQCARYIELNPVRAAMVAEPGHYPWSSHRHTALGWDDPLIRPHAAYQRLGATPGEQQAAWRALVTEAVPPDEIEAIRRHLQQQHPFGPARFRQAIEAQVGRPCGPRRIGRPPKGPVLPCPKHKTAL